MWSKDEATPRMWYEDQQTDSQESETNHGNA